MADDNLLRVTGIRVTGLFGRYSHEVTLRLDERVTIIHGPNGVGKTVILRLTAALLAGKLMEFGRVPFANFEVSLSDNSTLGVRKEPSNKSDKFELGVVFYLRKNNAEIIEHRIKGENADINLFARRIEAESPYLSRVGPDQYLDRRTDELMSAYEVAANFTEFVPDRSRSQGLFDIPDWMLNLQERVGVHFIEAQRLLRFAPERNRDLPRYPGVSRAQFVETVKDYAKDLEQRISGTLATYAKVSQSLDQSFPERLLKSDQWEGLSPETLKNKMQELEIKRQMLRQIGLIEQDAADPFDVSALEKTNSAQQSVMTLYVEDTAKKLGVLDELARRISLMLENINRKFTHKSIRISRTKGFTAVTPEGQVLELGALSSGEQHELVLLYDLLFRVKSNTLVLIDEPELSLHVTWQKTFLPDLLEIVSATKFDVLLATHSPFIVGDRSDLMVPLEADSQTNR